MEIVFEALFELFGELILGILVELVGSAFGSLFARPAPAGAAAKPSHAQPPYAADTVSPLTPKPVSPALKLAFYLCLGLVLGGLSLLLFPQSFTRSLDARMAVLISTPLACGLMMAGIGEYKRKHGRIAKTLESFGFGCAFALPMALLRFFFAT